MKSFDSFKENQHRFQHQIMSYPNVVGIGIGKKITNFVQTDEYCYSVLVSRKKPLSILSSTAIIPKYVGQDFITDVIEIGTVVIHSELTSRVRPVLPGYSIGHYKISAGTFGGIVYDSVTGERLILSNNHVLADSNNAVEGDPIVQPGVYDGGNVDTDIVGYLSRFVAINFNNDGSQPPPISPPQPPPQPPSPSGNGCKIAKTFVAFGNFMARLFGSSYRVYTEKVLKPSEILDLIQIDQDINTVDAAVVKPSVEVSNFITNIGLVQGVNLEPTIGMEVQKSGRTSGYTRNKIIALNVMVNVGYDYNRVAIFTNQILVGPLSQPGDSGSLVLDMSNKVVGLLFAGSSQATIINPIDEVMTKLGVHF